MTTCIRGHEAEGEALSYLIERGLTLVTRNYRAPCGEIDLIMRDLDCLVFIEVRFRKNDLFGGGLESVDYKKQRKLIKTAQYYLGSCQKYDKISCRFDVVSIENSIEWIPDAFEMSD